MLEVVAESNVKAGCEAVRQLDAQYYQAARQGAAFLVEVVRYGPAEEPAESIPVLVKCETKYIYHEAEESI